MQARRWLELGVRSALIRDSAGEADRNERSKMDGMSTVSPDLFTRLIAKAPVARERMHWVACEAIGAVVTLASAFDGEDGFEPSQDKAPLWGWAEQWWSYCEDNLIEAPGRWWHELDENNQPSTVTWPGKPDAYHVAQMLLLPDLPLAPTFALALKQQG